MKLTRLVLACQGNGDVIEFLSFQLARDTVPEQAAWEHRKRAKFGTGKSGCAAPRYHPYWIGMVMGLQEVECKICILCCVTVLCCVEVSLSAKRVQNLAERLAQCRDACNR
jgi:hypothetical protein